MQHVGSTQETNLTNFNYYSSSGVVLRGCAIQMRVHRPSELLPAYIVCAVIVLQALIAKVSAIPLTYR